MDNTDGTTRTRVAADSAYDDWTGDRIPGTLADGSFADMRHHRKPPTVHKASIASIRESTKREKTTSRKRSSEATDDGRKTVASNGNNDRTLLEVPFDKRYEARNAGAKYDSATKTSYYDGPLPAKLKAWCSQDYSYTRWVEDQLNGRVRLVEQGPVMFTPRPHQETARKAILKAYSDGWPGFLIADSTGLGKTLSIVSGVCSIAKARKASPSRRMKTLIVCPKGAMGVWRQTLKAYADSMLLRPLIINYQQLNKLIKEPADVKTGKYKNGRKMSAKTKNRRIASKGTPKINFDVIVFDESHYLKNYGSSAVSMSACTIARLDEDYVKGRKPFVVYSTATPGSTPLNLAIMAPTLSKALDPKVRKHVSPSDWPKFLNEHGFNVKPGSKRGTWNWVTIPWYGAKSTDPKERAKYEKAKEKALVLMDADTERIGDAWTRPGSPYISRDPTQLKDWPKQPVEPFYIELDSEGKAMYEDAWTRFRSFLDLKKRGQTDPKDALTENLRFRQKASLLKAPVIADHAADLVESGNQVFIGCEFLETVDIIMEALRKKRIPAVEFTGRVSDVREENRIKFQKGEAKVIVCNVAEAVSFHAGEILPDGSNATMAQRISIIADVRQNPNDCIQQMGRAHRDGQCSPVEFPVILDTVDVKVMDSFIKKARNLKKMKGDDDPDYLDRVFEDIS